MEKVVRDGPALELKMKENERPSSLVKYPCFFKVSVAQTAAGSFSDVRVRLVQWNGEIDAEVTRGIVRWDRVLSRPETQA